MDILEASKKNFKIFCKFVNPDFDLAPHHLKFIEKLQEIAEGKNKRLIIVCPPQRGKSTFSSVYFPAYLLGNNPNARIIVACYGQELSLKMTRDTKALMSSDRYQTLCGETKFRKDLQRADFFQLESSSGYFRATSIGGALTGFSADYLIIDDPFRDMQAALSEKYRNDVEDWYTSVALTRLSPKGSIIIANTRWHQSDLVGKLLEKDPDKWEVVHIKAIEDDDSVCWPSRYTLEDYENIKAEVGSRDFNALYQGNPSDAGQEIFNIENFRYFDEKDLPQMLWVRSWDVAMTTGTRSDYSACALVAIDREGNIYIKNIQRYKLNFNELIDKIEQVADADGEDVHIVIENISIGISAFEEVKRRLADRVVRKAENSHLRKIQKCMIFASRLEIEKVFLQKYGSWQPMFKDEVMAFPGGIHDDMVDATSNAVNYLANKNGQYSEKPIFQVGSFEYFEELSRPVFRSRRRGSKLL